MGDSTKVKSFAGAQTKQIDLGGRTVIPGINDAHNHLEIHATNQVDVELKSMDPTADEVNRAIAGATAKAPKDSLLSVSIGPNVLHDVSVSRDSLDKVSPNDAVILTTLTGQGFILNSAALKVYGVADNQPDPLGGRFERDSSFRLTGVVREYAGMNMERYLADKVSDADAIAQLRQTLTDAEKFGITTIQDMSNAIAPDRAVVLFEKVPTDIRIRELPKTQSILTMVGDHVIYGARTVAAKTHAN
jgi:predicted amidohydrolase YtcJ